MSPTLGLGSLGMYPTDACYDPNRSSWLPYWIDDSAESACKYGTSSLVGQMGGVVGAAGADVASAAGDLVGGFLSNAANQALNPTNFSGLLTLAVIGVAVFVVMEKM